MSDLRSRLADAIGDRYRVEREAGRGATATVFVARDLKHDRDVAIKVLHPELTAAVSADRFLREIGIEARLQHPHIVPLLDSGAADGLLYYVMPFIDGQSLRGRMASGPLPVDEAVRLWREIIDAIAYAHRHGIVHRDIKPENVLVSDRHALVADFGIAKALGPNNPGDTLTAAGVALGTPAYMSPEQVSGDDEVDHRTDVFALGVLAYEMLTGRSPFRGSNIRSVLAAVVAEKPEAIEQLRPEVPTEMAEIVRRCMEKDPARRWGSADELLARVDSYVTASRGSPGAIWRRATATRRARLVTAAVVAFALVLVSTTTYAEITDRRREQWARSEGFATLRRLAESRITDSLFMLLPRVRAALPDHPDLAMIARRNFIPLDLQTAPAGVTVSWLAFRGDTSGWNRLGETPLDSALLPISAHTSPITLKLEKAGYKTRMIPFGLTPFQRELSFNGIIEMVPVDSLPGFVRIPRFPTVLADARGQPEQATIPSFDIARHEVTNREFRNFVDGGGYTRDDLWQHEIVENGRAMTRAEASRLFVDRTGRPGPATWEGGAIPPGKEDHPVSGISWYEAEAYARFVGMQLPTIHHWRLAATFLAAGFNAARSTLESSDTRPVGTGGLSMFGVSDMAGNVREWCVNGDARGRRYLLGGAFSDMPWSFTEAAAAEPLSRVPGNGLRLIRPVGGDTTDRRLAADFRRGYRDYSTERPVSDAEFATIRRLYDYDPVPLNARVVAVDSSNSDFVKETVAFSAAYGAPDTIRAHILIPRRARPPFQAVVFGPPGPALSPSSSEFAHMYGAFVATAGRVFVAPVIRNTYERVTPRVNFASGPVHNFSGELLGPNTYRDEIVLMIKDYRRTLDYLVTRPDIDSARLGFIGFSWGGRIAPVLQAVEPRIRASVIWVAGYLTAPRRPEVDEINFTPRSTVPTLLLSGRYDDVFPLESMVKPFFEMLGTPREHKRQIVYPTQHFLPRAGQIAETLNWFDKYLGPVGAARH